MEINIIFLIVGMIGLWFGSGIVVDYGQKIATSLHNPITFPIGKQTNR